MFWNKQRKKRQRLETRGYIKSPQRQGLTTSATYGGMGVRELQLRMELLVDPVISSRRSVFEPAKQLAAFAKVEQDRFLNCVDNLRNTSVELAYNFCHFAPPCLRLVGEEHWDDWIARLLAAYDDSGVSGAVKAMQDVNLYVQSITHTPASVSLEEVSRVLENFVIGLHGRRLNIEASDVFYTDTESIRLPEIAAKFDQRTDNFCLYKCMAVHQWSQTWFGTWRMNVHALVNTYKDPERALSLFHKLETARLDAHIARELPGVARAMQDLQAGYERQPLSKSWQRAITRLREADTTVRDTMFFLETVYKEPDAPADKVYQGQLNPRAAWATIRARQAREKEAFAKMLATLQRQTDYAKVDQVSNQETDARGREGFSVKEIADDTRPDGYKIELRFDDQGVEISDDVQQLLESILQDLGEIPDEYLVPAGESAHDRKTAPSEDAGSYVKNAAEIYLYDEWDHSRQKYRTAWCHLRELSVSPMYDDFVTNTLRKHRGLLKHLQRTFEALREDDKRVKRQPYGDDVDLDAVIEAFSDTQTGLEASQNLFTRSRKIDRDIAVTFMIDMSGSTTGWVNKMEREALVLLCEALEILGDRYAIYGFSGFTHKRCELYKVKEFDEAYSDAVKARISGIQAQDYTRMGVAIRHLTKLLHRVEARTRLLITLSDGRPDDQDGYRGRYGIEDTRRALIEAKFSGIHPFCITIDKQGMDYLQHMYGGVNFAVIDQIDKLPYKVSDVYRRITV